MLTEPNPERFPGLGLLDTVHPVQAVPPIARLYQAVREMLGHPEDGKPHPADDAPSLNNSALDLTDTFEMRTYGDIFYGTVCVLKTRVIPPKDVNNDSLFQTTLYAEISSLLHKGIFEFVPCTAAEGYRIYTSRLVDEIKDLGTPQARAKSRFVLCGHSDVNHGVITHAPTVQRSYFRLLHSIHSQQDF